jgi:hypothetical protein
MVSFLCTSVMYRDIICIEVILVMHAAQNLLTVFPAPHMYHELNIISPHNIIYQITAWYGMMVWYVWCHNISTSKGMTKSHALCVPWLQSFK